MLADGRESDGVTRYSYLLRLLLSCTLTPYSSAVIVPVILLSDSSLPAKLTVSGLPLYSVLYAQDAPFSATLPVICTTPRLESQLPVKSAAFCVKLQS